ncbi:MAG: Ni/Fe hydrogenase subunit alpha [Alphaproteobacteria bacterium]|nr:Ni/Fe hydrogenase subunit alpha [Alphaproteobacteria bacterium]
MASTTKKKSGSAQAAKKASAKKPAAQKKSASGVTRTIKVDELSRVEGEGALTVRVVGGVVKEIKFRIFEPPRFFEAFLRGRNYMDVPDITARICGICPLAYLMGSQQAMESALGIKVTQPIRDLRRLIYCGEWIESHVLHAAMLHAPDFLGLDDILQLAAKNKPVVEKALRLKKLGNDILEIIGGGRAIHPVNTRVGGFYKMPSKKAIRALADELKWGIDAAVELAKLFGTFSFPDYDYDYHCVSLHRPDEYPILEGNIFSNRGIDIPAHRFFEYFQETHVQHSTALHGSTKVDGKPYLTGPIARYNNNYKNLTKLAKQTAKEVGLKEAVTNPFKSILVRMIETIYACEEALRLVKNYEEPDRPYVEAPALKAAEGVGCTEAPRGMCVHRYKLDDKGFVLGANIVPPTAQNQPQIERDLLGVVEESLHLSEEALTIRCEQTIRNYDPCISCSTHFLKLNMIRE